MVRLLQEQAEVLMTLSSSVIRGTCLLVALSIAALVDAASFRVESDEGAGDGLAGDGVCQSWLGDCTLLAAIEEANALPGGDAIVLPPGTYPAGLGLQVTDHLVIGGAGAERSIVDLGGFGETVFMSERADLALLGLTVTGGNSSNVGGGVRSYGGHLTIINSVIRGNVAGNVGGGIYKEGGVLTIAGSTIHDNFAWNVGGGISATGLTTLVNSTVSGNRVLNTGGGIYNGGTMRLVNCTVTENSCMNSAAGVDSRSDGVGHLTLENSILANNRLLTLDPVAMELVDIGQGGDCISNDVSGNHNLLQSNDCFTAPGMIPCCALVGEANLIGVDARLGPLADNGGQTPTRAPAVDSAAIDAGSPALPGSGPDACPATDQRAVARPQGLGCDIGAHEFGPCGNGLVEASELCDDGNAFDGDGCDSNCTPTGCGNGLVSAGEECDDGNATDGDCCSSGCVLTVDADLADAAGESSLLVREDDAAALRWTVKSTSPASTDDLGDPTTETDYALCVVDETGAQPSLVLAAEMRAGERCGERPCWRRTGHGFVYRNPSAGPGQLGLVRMSAGASGTTLKVTGAGRRLRFGRLPLLPPVRVVMQRSDGASVFSARYSATSRNQPDQFAARSR